MSEDVCYEKPFLKEVITRIDFAAPIEKLDKGVPTKLVNSVVKKFPIVEPADVLMHELSAVDEENVLKSKPTAIKHDGNTSAEERDRQLTIAPAIFLHTVPTLHQVRGDQGTFSRGCRCSQLSVPRNVGIAFWLALYQPDRCSTRRSHKMGQLTSAQIYSPAETSSRQGRPSRAWFRMRGAALRSRTSTFGFQFGLPNPDHPAPVRRPLFVLDIDARVSEAHELTERSGHMDEAHQRIQAIFERSISRRLYGRR